ncbi:di-heme enzyme [Tistrella bauzanensis]|uniref:Di-heme enzyme n=1 Tax=Tistrella bauzanensis TaxID=657419 RepID=A0ABQ1IPP8_9PROT|nr:methanobactin export MATE transporter MbnM [Tistrella bauzanensis]GGB46864.1 di-heme enzyme [Tistrella bauzanensis]
MIRAVLVAAVLGLGGMTGPTTMAAPQATGDWVWDLPAYVPPPRVPDDNPMTVAKVTLGRRLFHDPRLSGNGTLACSGCHVQALGFADGRAHPVGATGAVVRRNAQGLANVAWRASLTWANPALVTLEAQMAVPLYGTDPVEMGVTDANRAAVLDRFRADPEVVAGFRTAFPDDPRPVSFISIIRAIAAYQRSLISFDSRYDRWLQGRADLTAAERRGHDLFFGERAECHHCHGSFNFDDQVAHILSRVVERQFHNTGLYNIDGEGAYPATDRGLIEHTGLAADMGAFRAPSLRNVAVTGPYMHDGGIDTLDAVLDTYAAGGRLIPSGPDAGDGRLNRWKSDLIVRIELSPTERADIVAFLKTLTDERFLSGPTNSPHQIR